MRSQLVCSLLLTFAATPRSALGAELPSLGVVRAPEVGDCPDARALAGSVALLEGRYVLMATDAPTAFNRIEVSIDREPAEEYHATIQVRGERRAKRELRDAGPTCAPLWDALTLALSLIVDGLPEPPAAPSADRPAEAPGSSGTAPSTTSEHARVDLGVGALGSSALVGPLAGGLAGRAALEFTNGMAFGIEGRASAGPALASGPGTVRVELFAAVLDACYALNSTPKWVRASGCVEAGVGGMRGVASGYVGSTSESLRWLVAGAGTLADFPVSAPFGIWLRGEALVPLVRERFWISGISQPVYQPGTVGVSAGGGLRVTIW